MLSNQTEPEIHLLSPDPHSAQANARLSEQAARDLGLAALAEALAPRAQLRPQLRDAFLAMLRRMTTDPDEIRYRQEVLQDLLDSPALAEGLEAVLPRLSQLGFLRDYPYTTFLERVINRLGELETYVDCVRQLRELFEDPRVLVRSRGFLRLRDALIEQERQPEFQSLVRQLPELRRQASGVSSITIGINLDAQLRPVAATLLSFNDKPFAGRGDTLISRLLGESANGEDSRGIARLHVVPKDMPSAPTSIGGKEFRRPDPFLFPLFRDLDQTLRRVMEPVSRALQAYMAVHSHLLAELEVEVAFFLSGARLVRQMQAAGLAMCRAEIAPREERVCTVRSMYNLLLALRTLQARPGAPLDIVPNDVDFGEARRIFVLTGPNQGGKTTYTQGVGVLQVLFQAGLYVPGETARISPADNIFTHFPLEEKPETEAGRLGEEAQRLGQIFQQATRCSLVLFNESLTTTSPGESIYLARDILRALRLWGVRAIFVTHLHELAEDIDALNNSTAGESRIASLVAGVVEDGDADSARRSFRITASPPMGRSYARDIAHRHGISYEQLAQAHQERENRTG